MNPYTAHYDVLKHAMEPTAFPVHSIQKKVFTLIFSNKHFTLQRFPLTFQRGIARVAVGYSVTSLSIFTV